MTSIGARRLQLNFGNLPLVEVALRVSFESPIHLKFSIINQVKEDLGDSFPALTEASRIETAPGVASSMTLGVGQIPGAVYSGNRNGVIIALQGQVVVVRWLKRVEKGAAEYPRYSVLRAALWKAYEAVGGACGGSALPLAAVNMSYVNLLDIGHHEPVLTRYFSEIAQVKMEGFTGAVLELRSAFEGLTIAIGKSGLLEFAEELSRRLASVLRAAAGLPKVFLAIAAGIAAILTIGAGLLAFLGLASIAFLKVSAALAEMSLAFTAASAASSTTAISMTGVTVVANTLTVSLSALLIPLALVAVVVGTGTAVFIKFSAAIKEADAAAASFRTGLASVTERMKTGFTVAREFTGVTAKQARGMGDLDATIRRLTVGIRGLATAQAQAGDRASQQRIQTQIDQLKALRTELMKTVRVQKEGAVEGIKLEDVRQRAFRATITERRSLLAGQLK
ncbi:MAG: hypothetical protein IID40_03695, partial [Planctomycetes bacterium]|nr:hypothetical protein [Planctomycetota bacterium]